MQNHTLGTEEELLVTVTVESDDNNSDDDESVYVKSLRLENKGTADLDALDNIYIEVDGDKFDGEVVEDDYLVFDFGNGVEIENDEEEDFEVFADVTADADSGDTLKLEISENSDIFAETEEGYGAPLDATSVLVDGSVVITIEAGSAKLGTSTEDDAEDVVAGSDVLLGQFDLEIEGEGITVDSLTITIGVTNASTTSGDAEDLLLEDVQITDADGNVLVSKEDADGT